MADPVFQPEEHANESMSQGTPLEATRPFDIVQLPTKGRLYTEGPLAGRDHVEVYYLTAKEEDILTAPNIIQSGKMLDILLKSVLKDRSIDPAKMYLGDRNTILVWLRSTGYGAEYPATIQCEFCSSHFINTFDLSSLDVRTLDIEPDEDGLFSVQLPATKRIARVQFLTAEADAALDAAIEQRAKKLGSGGNPMTARLQAYVQEIDGLEPDAKRGFIEQLPVADARAIRKFIADHEPSVVMKQDAVCTECGKTNQEVTVPVTARFFWPDA